jgi:signal transduction histidine kinase
VEQLVVGTATPRTVVLADGRSRRGEVDEPTRRVAVRLAAGTVVILATLMLVGYFASEQLARREALSDVRAMTESVTNAAVEPHADLLVQGDPTALAELDDAVRNHLLVDGPIERVKLWTADGRIVYSDARELVGQVFPLSEGKRAVLRTGVSSTAISDLDDPENRLDRSDGAPLLEVYAAVQSSQGPLLFEAYMDDALVRERQHQVLGTITWVAVLGLVLFGVAQLWLATACLRWLQRERGRLAQQSAATVEEQRRQVARDLHDGVVQDLLGAGLLVNGAVAPLTEAGRSVSAEALRAAEVGIRSSIRSLRTMIIDIYPATLRSAGLAAALMDLVDPVRTHGTLVHLDLPEDLDLPDHLEAALYRTAQEAVRNATRKGRATELSLTVRTHAETVELEVRDDGAGFDPDRLPADGHLGLRGAADHAEALGGVLEVTSAPGAGTSLRMVLPR